MSIDLGTALSCVPTASVHTRCARLSGGIALKNDELDTQVLMTTLSEALAIEASRSEATRKAIERMLTKMAPPSGPPTDRREEEERWDTWT